MKLIKIMRGLLRLVLIVGLAFGGAFVYTALQYIKDIELPFTYTILGVYALISVNYVMIKEIIK